MSDYRSCLLTRGALIEWFHCYSTQQCINVFLYLLQKVHTSQGFGGGRVSKSKVYYIMLDKQECVTL